ncbi:hypothetical protein PPL_09325 [Heterostelium album PN500]|uniref:DUF4291 domain-containing protein n=1 Tax=Heterostelium pallidum (strain ATCC 26659 / Pp 5 / PN500) TaxID=670386 RepID=D3BL93_HETP5|nr:hypothetical protein PPL_09325 [Heterostelium album PN500]EFA77827.1 hypothetical protein PPL_09325 [Heterostelium album PN500]|eukprot:XP_020429955.1 hypothetical protein PPL_09325 [Heterostelium album PN500]
MKERIIRAIYDDTTITLYQAFNSVIGRYAVKNQSFIGCPGFKIDRMTWVKPSFLWMMYRSGWATKHNQECILAIRIKREGFEWALQNSSLSQHLSISAEQREEHREQLLSQPVRIQWDPEKDIDLKALPYRSIQIGLSGVAVTKYLNEWIVSIEDITPKCKTIYQLLATHQREEALRQLPQESIYNIDNHHIEIHINLSV